MKSEIIQKLLDEIDAQPWHEKLRRNLKVKRWIWRANIRHYKNWINSKQYRLSYGDCDCVKNNREIDEEYCKNNPKCILNKTGVSYIDSF